VGRQPRFRPAFPFCPRAAQQRTANPPATSPVGLGRYKSGPTRQVATPHLHSSFLFPFTSSSLSRRASQPWKGRPCSQAHRRQMPPRVAPMIQPSALPTPAYKSRRGMRPNPSRARDSSPKSQSAAATNVEGEAEENGAGVDIRGRSIVHCEGRRTSSKGSRPGCCSASSLSSTSSSPLLPLPFTASSLSSSTSSPPGHFGRW
jgi:hypothetical protein